MVRLRKPYRLSSAGERSEITASLCVFVISGKLFVRSFVVSFEEKQPLFLSLNWLGRSSKWPQLASLIGLSTTHARFVLAWRRSSQSLSLFLGSTPNLEATLSSGLWRVKGRLSLQSWKGRASRPFSHCNRSSPHKAFAFLWPDFLARS